MRVLIDAHMVGSHETGNETYVVNLLRHMPGQGGVECGAAIAPAALGAGAPEAGAPEVGNDLAGVELVPLRLPGNWTRLLYTLPAACRDWRADVLHVTYVGPLFPPCPMVVSVHDVSFRRYPEFFSPRDRLLFATLLPATLRRASAVIAISAHARQEILEVFPFLEGRVHVTLIAASDLFRPMDRVELQSNQRLHAIRAHYGLNSDYILAVGNLQPRKNLLRLVNAFASIRRQDDTVQLMIAGKAQWLSSEVYAAVQRLGLGEAVTFTGYVPEEDLVPLYNAARVFVYPSIYEGFGLPILEAMACGTPVVTSNTSSMPEIAGDAALLVDPYDVEQIAAAIHQVLTSPGLARSLSEKGLERAGSFSWSRTAQETLEVYRRVAVSDADPRHSGRTGARSERRGRAEKPMGPRG